MYKWWLVFWIHSPWMKYHLFVITSSKKSKEFQISDVKEFNHLKMWPTKKIKCDVINNTNKYCSYQSFFSFFFGDKKSPNDNIASNFGQKFPFLSKRIGQTSSYCGELVTTNLCTTYNFNDLVHVMLKCWNFGILKMGLLVFFCWKN